MTTVNRLAEVALQRLEKGALSEAERLFTLILDQVPDHAEARSGLARIAVEQGMFAQALRLLENGSQGGADRTDTLIVTARVYLGVGRIEEAVFCMEKACALRPGDLDVHRYSVEAYIAAKQKERALHHGAEAVRLHPAAPEAHACLGDAYLAIGDPKEAVRSYDRAVAINPDNWKAFADRGYALLMSGLLAEAALSFTFADALHPMEPSVLLPLAGALIDLGKHADAQLVLRKLSAVMPHDPQVLRYTAVMRLKQGDVQSAVGELAKLLSLTPNNPEVELQLGSALMKDGKTESAVRIFTGIIENHPDYLPAYVQKAEAELFLQEFEKGFGTIEHMQTHVSSPLAMPLWNGEDLQGKTLFIYPQFGLDAFNLFIRFAKDLKQKGATVAVECTDPVNPLISASASVDLCLPVGLPMEEADFRSPMERLPRLLGIAPDRMQKAPYLSPDETRRRTWENAFERIPKIKVGLMWRKEVDARRDVYRSVPLEAFLPLAKRDDIQLISLQTSCGLEELEAVDFKDRIIHLPDIENADLKERLAAAAALDLIIAPDSYTAEIAAAAGLPVWILVGCAPAWYFGQSGEESVWLPSARLFRQTAIGKWDDPIERMLFALDQRIWK